MNTFQERLGNFHDAGANIYGVSVDSPFALNAFREDDGLKFDLVSDANHEVVDADDVDFADLGIDEVAKRSVFVVDSDGTVTYAWCSDDPGVEPDYDGIETAAAEARTHPNGLFPPPRTVGMNDQTELADSASNGRVYDPDAEHAFPDERLNAVLETVDADPEIQAYLDAQNVNPVVRKRYNDHGAKHISIVRNRALCLYDLLKAGNVDFNGAADEGLDEADEPVIIALAATLHDIGHVVHRTDHPYYSIPLAADVLDRLLPEFEWYDVEDRVRLKGEVLHAIVAHDTAETPLTLEAGIVRVSDALDMEHGRSRTPYESGGRGINTVSSQAIREVTLRPGDGVPVLVEIEMTDAAGVYQVDSLLKAKLEKSSLEDYIRIVAVTTRNPDEQLIERIEL